VKSGRLFSRRLVGPRRDYSTATAAGVYCHQIIAKICNLCFASIYILFFAAPAEFAPDRAPSASDHDRDDGVAESPYMLIHGSACLTN
jgi:hypothetical protein